MRASAGRNSLHLALPLVAAFAALPQGAAAQANAGEVLGPALPPGAEVEVIVLLPSARKTGEGDPYAFLKILEGANLDGPDDWSAHLDDYLYHGKSDDSRPGIS